MKVHFFLLAILRPVMTNIFVLLLSFSQTLQALEIPPEQYPFPTKDPYIATVFSSFSSSSLEYQTWSLIYRPERAQKKYPLQKAVLDVQVKQQAKEAPLAIIVAGLGGHSLSTNSMALADIYSKAGYHVITLPNNLSWSYTMSVSESAVPGYMPRDAAEYYQMIKWVLDHAQNKRKMRISSTVLVGYSNGGLLAGFLAPLDQKQEHPLFKKILLINPAVDIMYGIQQLDYLNDVIGGSISQNRKNYIKGAIYTLGPDVKAAKDPIKEFFAMLKKQQITSKDIQWVIGDQYRKSLSEVILFSHFVQDRGFLKTPYSKYKLNVIEAEAWGFNFMDYMNKIVVPTLPPEDLLIDFTFAGSLYSQIPNLKNDARVFVFTNSDDFILKPEDIPILRAAFGQRFFLYPYGGHMGNIMVPFNVEMYLKVSQ